MKFYKLEGEIMMSEWAMDLFSRREVGERSSTVNSKSYDFNMKNKGKLLVFISSVDNNRAVIGMVARDSRNIDKEVNSFLQKVDLVIKGGPLEEITFRTFRKMLADADRCGFVDSDDEIIDYLDLSDLEGHARRGIQFDENLLSVESKEALYNKAEGFLAVDDVKAELDRIYEGHKGRALKGHPVHYVIQTDDTDARREMYKTVLSALYANGRIQNKRYCYLNMRTDGDFFVRVLDTIYRSCMGGSVVIRFCTKATSEDDEAGNSRWVMENVAELINKYSADVLTILCFPRECTELKEDLFKCLNDYTFVEITEELAYGEQAERFLKCLAKEAKVRTNKKLFQCIEKDRGYLTTDLKKIFTGWLNDRLKSDCYVQYKDLKTAQAKQKAEKPKGTAYSELMEMIGLTEAKRIINQAIDYNKAQKIFANKGMQSEVLSRHMVFTGNPGTAKTSVARLYARIMKENGLISRGHLVETGRADLVGRFVGWTAQIIKDKFKQAEGGVLFIDEAYSLVDDRNGSYGDEAINTIVQEMENHRKDVVVIFAGYPAEMEKFLAKNPGLSSRIAFHVPFEDYDKDDLCKIANLIAKQKNLSITEDALCKLEGIFETARAQKDFGNGRFVRNVIEHAKMAQASRLLAMDYSSVKRSDIETLCADDFEIPKEIQTEKKKNFGFCA